MGSVLADQRKVRRHAQGQSARVFRFCSLRGVLQGKHGKFVSTVNWMRLELCIKDSGSHASTSNFDWPTYPGATTKDPQQVLQVLVTRTNVAGKQIHTDLGHLQRSLFAKIYNDIEWWKPELTMRMKTTMKTLSEDASNRS